MRRPYQVGLKLRELMRKHVEAYVKDKTSRSPRNCNFGHPVSVEETEQVLVLCTSPECSPQGNYFSVCKPQRCMACTHYCPRVTTREEALASFKEMVSDPVTKRGLYPDVVALEWVLDNSYHEAIKSQAWYVRVLLRSIGLLEDLVRKLTSNGSMLSWVKVPSSAPTQSQDSPGVEDGKKGV